METTGVQIRRVYEPPQASDGTRVLVDRLWPRGLTKRAAALDEWLKEVAPSNELRRWYGHVAQHRAEFVRRYRRELADPAHREALDRLREWIDAGPVTLLTATRDVSVSHVPIIVSCLEAA